MSSFSEESQEEIPIGNSELKFVIGINKTNNERIISIFLVYQTSPELLEIDYTKLLELELNSQSLISLFNLLKKLEHRFEDKKMIVKIDKLILNLISENYNIDMDCIIKENKYMNENDILFKYEKVKGNFNVIKSSYGDDKYEIIKPKNFYFLNLDSGKIEFCDMKDNNLLYFFYNEKQDIRFAKISSGYLPDDSYLVCCKQPKVYEDFSELIRSDEITDPITFEHNKFIDETFTKAVEAIKMYQSHKD